MAKLGELVLNDGNYEGKRIISEEYLKDMLTPHLKLGERFGRITDISGISRMMTVRFMLLSEMPET